MALNEGNPASGGIKSDLAKREEEILKFWQDHQIFEKSLAKDAPGGNFVFYDGPPFATGLPHYGHILASAIKDAVPRYQSMRGKHVERRWGWDCHGLPIENIVEKDLKISGKKEIEAYGVEKFNAYARSKVLEYVHEWKKTIERMGRWVDFDGSYKTMDNTFIESTIWAFKQIYDKGLVYESTKVLPYCPRCETPVSNSEIAMDQSYKDITDISVYAKFQLLDEPNTYVLAWTTTPWTLPGNFALAVDSKISYVKAEKDGVNYIVAKDLADKVLKENYKIIEEIKGKKLVGKSYQPIFNYFKEAKLDHKKNAWKIYAGDFITTNEGTGIVHVAPGYGEEDMELAKKENIPWIHHVDQSGKFTEAVTDFVAIPVKPKGDPSTSSGQAHQSADILIIKKLAHEGTLFAKEKIVHAYPHCFRCDTPLYYYAIPAWFIDIQKSKKKFLKLNEKIHWVPEHLKYGRFGKSAEGAPDWNISRNRYWASPLPIWKCEKCGKIEAVGSLDDIKKHTKRNKYWAIRHGESINNAANTISTVYTNPHGLTEKGREEIKEAARALKKEKIDLIFSSDFVRTRETAEIIKKETSFHGEINYDKRLREISVGEFEGKKLNEYLDFHGSSVDYFYKKPKGGEDLMDVRKRTMDFLFDIDQKYQNKNILIVSHEDTIYSLQSGSTGESPEVLAASPDWKTPIRNGETSELLFAAFPHNENYELDYHRPYIDDVRFECVCGGEMKRVKEVLDGWFESGSMPFAQKHYPFENKEWFKENFPAQFVAEYIAQTRTWFYYMHTVSTILFDSIPFQNVVTTGNVLGGDGQKMSKSKGNFPDPWILFNKYSVDAVRFYLFSSPIMKAEDINFSEKSVDEVNKKIILRLKNVVSFYELYKGSKIGILRVESKNILDQWIIARLNEVVMQVTEGMNNYEIYRALAPLDKFVDDLSTWYLRRSRDRFKSDNETDKQAALSTIRFVLEELSKLIAPFMPFLAEDIYQRVKVGNDKESVHLESWPLPKAISYKLSADSLLKEMEEVRKIVSLGLEARAKEGIKVRQPLAELKFRTDESDISENADYLELIKDEVNVKEAILDASIDKEIELNIEITPQLKEEGQVRELIRAIQELRKTSGLQMGEKASLAVEVASGGEALINKFKEEISKIAGLKEIKFTKTDGEEIKVDNLVFKLKIKD